VGIGVGKFKIQGLKFKDNGRKNVSKNAAKPQNSVHP
jgi:hypothetical protein